MAWLLDTVFLCYTNAMQSGAKKFKPANFEAKWQKKWESDKTFSPDMDSAKRPYYNLMMFPYPSAEGMHVGNMYAHTGADIHGRFRRMQGYDVFEPIGLDGFGIHSENYAMKVGRHPKEQAQVSEENFYRQMHSTGSGFDWQRTVETYDPEYYKWTQWLFTQMFKAGLAYKEKASVNFCPSCKTVLADEQVIAGECERCGSIVEKRMLEQWFFRITQYAGRLLDNIPKLDWTQKVKVAQTNWIGRSKGALITFPIADFRLKNGEKPNFVLLQGYKGGADRNFIPWLKERLEASGFSVQTPELPQRDNPREQEQVTYVLETVKMDENTVVVGHSLGAVIALKVLEQLSHGIEKLVLVGGFAQPSFKDGVNRPYSTHFTWEYDWSSIQSKVREISILHDENDPVISDEQSKKLADNLGVPVQRVKAKEPHFRGKSESEVLKALIPTIDAFTTRPDTIFGATFMVIAPEHPIVSSITSLEYKIDKNSLESVKNYVKEAANKTEAERMEDNREKTGVFSGLYAVNPASGKKIPIWIADYVLAEYGTGAIMAVPAHDSRDYDFAKKYDLPICDVIMPLRVDTKNPPHPDEKMVERQAVQAIIKHPTQDKILMLDWKELGWKTLVIGGVEAGEDVVTAALREIKEETGYKNLKFIKQLGGQIQSEFYAKHKGENRRAFFTGLYFELENEERDEVIDEEKAKHEVLWVDRKKVPGLIHAAEIDLLWERLENDQFVYEGAGLLQNSGKLDGYHSEDDSDKIFAFISDNGIGIPQEQYHLRDWLISRQRYWGPPIPMIYCQTCATAGKSWFTTEEAKVYRSTKKQASNNKEKRQILKFDIWDLDTSADMAGWYPVPDTDLPVLLPDIQDFKPMGTGSSPLANHPEFYEILCPECGSKAVRETDVSDTFLDSAWYFLRYLATDWHDMPFPSRALAERGKRKAESESEIENWKLKIENSQQRSKFLPVSIYIGGAEHSVLHLLYARFVTMVLHDLGYTDFEEPFKKFFAHGLLIKEGAKMSKSKGNVIVPDEYIAKYGADTLRSYLMFLGPFNQGGDFYDTGIEGMFRFLRRIWYLIVNRSTLGDEAEVITRARHKTIAGVTKDFEEFGYNTAIAKLMELYNLITEGKDENEKIVLSPDTVSAFLQMLAPFAPHMTEELWHTVLDKKESIHHSAWPSYDKSLIQDATVVIVVQVNGKRRGEVVVSREELENQEKIQEQAQSVAAKYLQSPAKKVIYVPGKIINFVL